MTDAAGYFAKRSAAAVLRAMQTSSDAPLRAMIEIADRCNEVCVHCYQVQGRKGEMTTEQVYRVLDELSELGVLFVTLSGGEATLRSDFLDIVRYARKKRFAVKLYTNGLTMTDALADALAEAAVQEVQISIYSHRAEVHDWVTRVPGSWAKSVDGVRRLVARKIAVVVKTPVMTVNAHEHEPYIAFVRSLGADYSLDAETLFTREDGDRSLEALSVNEAEARRIIGDPAVFGMHGTPKRERSLDESVCGACSSGVHVEANGEMRPCTQLDVSTGNAVRDGVVASWKGNEAARAIRQVTWRDLHGCRDCELRSYCTHCFAKAKMNQGDALGPHADACAHARIHYGFTIGTDARVQPNPAVSRSSELGPYRVVDVGVLEPIEDVVTEEDLARRAANAWAIAPVGQAPEARAMPGQLVQIRRPNKKAAHVEQIPAANGDVSVSIDRGRGIGRGSPEVQSGREEG